MVNYELNVKMCKRVCVFVKNTDRLRVFVRVSQ